ncbi:STAS domain-containing protein [Prauserella flavalba]|uniref:STAS domain-containing protein n=1 Tax=Prauserella flavalba TaxID=1477506 RepID=UPI0036E01FC7
MMEQPLPPDSDLLVHSDVCWPAVDVALVVVSGEIDLGTAPQLVAAITGPLRSLPRVLVVDLRPVRFLGVAGLNALTESRATAAAHGVTVRIVTGGQGWLERPIQLCGLSDVLPGYQTVDHALETD